MNNFLNETLLNKTALTRAPYSNKLGKTKFYGTIRYTNTIYTLYLLHIFIVKRKAKYDELRERICCVTRGKISKKY